MEDGPLCPFLCTWREQSSRIFREGGHSYQLLKDIFLKIFSFFFLFFSFFIGLGFPQGFNLTLLDFIKCMVNAKAFSHQSYIFPLEFYFILIFGFTYFPHTSVLGLCPLFKGASSTSFIFFSYQKKAKKNLGIRGGEFFIKDIFASN